MRLQLKRIICTTDFSDLSKRAIPYAVAIAEEFNAKLYMCHIVSLPSTAAYGEILFDLVDNQKREVEYAHQQMDQLLQDRQVEWEPLVQIGHTADTITQLVEDIQADLVVTATHGRSGLKRLVLGSVTERLLHILPCPMLVIPAPSPDSHAPELNDFQLKKILIGCDFSDSSLLAFQLGLSLAQEFQSELHLVHVVEPPAYRNYTKATAGGGEDSPELKRYLNDRLEKLLPEDARHWCRTRTVLLDGKPDEALVDYADSNDIDLITLGIRGQGLVEKLFVGSTTERVLRRSSCPILSVCARAGDSL